MTAAPGSGSASPDEPGCMVDAPYLLALNVTIRQFDGAYWADASWAKDLDKHRAYLPQLTLFCPVRWRPPDRGWRRIDGPGLRIVGFADPISLFSLLPRLPWVLLRLWREVGRAEIVHSGVAGWPLPLGWFAAPFAKMRGKKLVLIVESAFWRLTAQQHAGLIRRLRANFWEKAARDCMRLADYAAYTQPDYRRTLPAPRAEGGKLVQASWIDAGDCLAQASADADWVAKRPTPLRFLFAARMLPEKGTAILAAALGLLADRDASVFVDIIGEGPGLADLREVARTNWGGSHVTFLDPQPYGPAFLSLLRDYHALLVPSLSDEQPRIVYDGCSQAVPTIASDLAGLRACIEDNITGLLIPAGDAGALADAMLDASAARLEQWGRTGLARAPQFTHDGLHAQRCRDLNALLSAG